MGEDSPKNAQAVGQDAFFLVFARATAAVLAAVVVRVRVGLHTHDPQRTAEGYVGRDAHRDSRNDPCDSSISLRKVEEFESVPTYISAASTGD